MSWLRTMRSQKSMYSYCKHAYHEAVERYRMDIKAYPGDGATVAADVAEIRVWRNLLYYLTENQEWLE